jgi:hypothetical protein
MAIKPFKQNITIVQGATLDLLVTWRTGDPAAPVDLTGCTARMQIREKVDSVTPLVTLTTENDGIELGGALGTVRRFMDADDTAALTFKSGVYDLEIEFADGTVRRLLSGSVSVSPEVTRSA